MFIQKTWTSFPDDLSGKLLAASFLDMKRACPFIYAALSAVPREASFEIGSIAVSPSRLYYNPNFIKHLTRAELNYHLIHEIYHVLMNHHERGRNRDPLLWNQACDLYVDRCICDNFRIRPGQTPRPGSFGGGETAYLAVPAGWTVDETIDIRKDSPESIYAQFTKREPQEPLIEKGDLMEIPLYEGKRKSPAESDSSQGVSGADNETGPDGPGRQDGVEEDGPDSSIGEKGYTNKRDPDLIEDKYSIGLGRNKAMMSHSALMDRIRKLYQKSERVGFSGGKGGIPISLQTYADDTGSRIDWRTVIRDRMVRHLSDEKSLAYPDRRFAYQKFYVEGRIREDQFRECVHLCIDTSASMSEKDLNNILTEITSFMIHYEARGRVILWDKEVEGVYPMETSFDLARVRRNMKGRGGTDPNGLFQYLDYDMPFVDEDVLILVFSDGCFKKPKNQYARKYGSNTIWILVGSQEAENFDPGFGTIVRYTER